jgi:hypothetical protein
LLSYSKKKTRRTEEIKISDKKRLIEAFVCNEKVLSTIHELTFPKANRFLPQPPAGNAPNRSVELEGTFTSPVKTFDNHARSVTPRIMSKS